jgi:hypothetical protein
MDMIAQAVEELRPVGLRVDRLHLDALVIVPLLRPVGLRVDVDPALPFPNAGEPAQRPEMRQRFGVDVVGLVRIRDLPIRIEKLL